MAHIPFLSHYLERKNIEYQNQLLARQVEEVQNIYLTMRGWRHDYHNHLQSMKAYVEMGQYDKLQEYLGLLENDLDQVNQLCDSGNVNLDAILNSKISLAEKNGIRVDYKAACPANLTVSDIDLCALIGNLIDLIHRTHAPSGPCGSLYPALYWCAEKPAVYFRYECNKGYCAEAGQRVYHHEARKSRAWAETDQSCCGKVRRIYQPAERARRFRDGDYAAAVKSSFQNFLILSDDSTEKFCRT